MNLFCLFFLIALPQLGQAAPDSAVIPFADALARADAVYLGQVEKVEKIPDTGPQGYNRRAQLKVLQVFKGKLKPKAEVYYLGYENRKWLDVPSALREVGGRVLVFSNGINFPHTDLHLGAENFPFRELDPKGIPEPLACRYRALVAFSQLERMDRVLDLSRCRKPPKASR